MSEEEIYEESVLIQEKGENKSNTEDSAPSVEVNPVSIWLNSRNQKRKLLP